MSFDILMIEKALEIILKIYSNNECSLYSYNKYSGVKKIYDKINLVFILNDIENDFIVCVKCSKKIYYFNNYGKKILMTQVDCHKQYIQRY